MRVLVKRGTQPVLVLQHQTQDHAAWLGTWLASHGIAADVRNTELHQDYPASIGGYRGLAILGGEMSANDPLQSLRDAERLILDAMDHGVPVIGHCLGGQLMAKALGARIVRSPSPEIGWHALQVADNQAARRWFGEAGEIHCFEWHTEAFELPPGAELLAFNKACPAQAFAIGAHLAMQFHVEVDSRKLAAWTMERDATVRDDHPLCHDGTRMRSDTARYLAAQQALADRCYRRWLSLDI